MWRNLFNFGRPEDMFTQALHRCHAMLDQDWEMYQASVKSLRQSDSADIEFDIFAADKEINASEREVRKKIVTHLSVSGSRDFSSALILSIVVGDIERIGDYTKNIYDLARHHPARLDARQMEPDLRRIESGVTDIFRDMIDIFKKSDEDRARHLMVSYKENLAKECDRVTYDIVAGKAPDLGSGQAAAVSLYARYLNASPPIHAPF